MANLDEEDVIEDDSFRTVLSFSPEVQEAIDQVLNDFILLILVEVGVAMAFGVHVYVYLVVRFPAYETLIRSIESRQCRMIGSHGHVVLLNPNHSKLWSFLSL